MNSRNIVFVISLCLAIITHARAQSDLARLPSINTESELPSHSGTNIALRSFSAKATYGGPSKADFFHDLKFGYDNGFVIASPDGLSLDTGKSPFLMRFGSWGHFRHANFNSAGPNPDLNQLEWERIRLVIDGHAFTPDFKYFFQYDADSDAGETVDLLDYYVTYDIGHDACRFDRGKLAMRFGKWKIPFARSREESGTRLEFADRSIAGSFFDFNRSIGIGLLGNVETCCLPVNWEVALTNGINTGGFRTGRANGELDRNFAVSGRFTSVINGDYGSDGEPDLNFRHVPAWRVGTGFAFSRVNRTDGMREFSRMRVVDSGATIDSLLPAAVAEYDISMFAVDSHVKYHGVSLITEYFFRYLSNFTGAPVPDLFDHGFLLQAGYFLVPHHLELLGRWSQVVGESGSLGVADESADEFALGMVWYIRGHNLKLTFDATHVNGAPLSDSALNVLPGDVGWLFRTQFQFKF